MAITNEYFGCVRFDDPHNHDRGWAARAGERAFRIKGTEDLSSDTLWLTNLSYNLMYDAGFAEHARFRRGDFLSESFCKTPKSTSESRPTEFVAYDLVSLLGIHADDWKNQVEEVAALFDRVMRLTHRVLGPLDMSGNTLSNCMRQSLYGPDPILSEKIEAGLRESNVSFVRCENRPEMFSDNARVITLTLPRVRQGIALCRVPLPSGEWHEISKRDLPAPENVLAWATHFDYPILARLTVDHMEPAVNRLLNFGTGRATRRWAVTEEIQCIAQFARVQIHEAYWTESVTTIPRVDAALEMFEPIHELSLSVGLFLENLWRGLCSNLPPKVHIRRGRPVHNTVAPFIRALDRHYCLDAALRLQQMGFSVTSYGKGKVSIVTQMPNSSLAEALAQMDLIPPFLDVSSDDIDLQSPFGLFKAFYVTGDRERLRLADEQIVAQFIEDLS